MPFARISRPPVPNVACAGLLLLFMGCGDTPAPDSDAAETAEIASVQEAAGVDGPPLGRYVCRQYTTTMGYLTLEEGGTYEVSGVRGRYRYDPQSGAMNWQGGSYDEWGWEGTYERVARSEGDGRPDEDVIRLNSEADGLRIDCYKMADD